MAALVAVALAGCGARSPVSAPTWQEGIETPQLSDAEFTELYARAVRERFPDLNVRVAGRRELEIITDTAEYSIYLDNAWDAAAGNPGQRSAVVARYLGTLESTLSATPVGPAPALDRVLPVVRGADLFAGGDPGPTEASFYSEPLAADLRVYYAVTGDGYIEYLTRAQIDSLGVPPSELRERAVDNLVASLASLLRQGLHGLYLIDAGGSFESSLLLVDDLWETQRDVLQGDVVAAVPTRDVILYTGSQATEALEALRRVSEEVYATGAYPVSRVLLVRRDGRWLPYEP